MEMRNLIDIITEAGVSEEVRRKFAELRQAEIDAITAFGDNRTRSNLEHLWSIRKEIDDLQAKYYPKPEPILEPSDDDYRGQHSAPDHDTGSPLFDLTLNGTYPSDFYQGRSYDYLGDSSDSMELNALGIIMASHNRPNMPITIYRSVPKNIPRLINVGDWVSIVRRYVVAHGRENLNNEFNVIQKRVYARDIFTAGDSLVEWGYDPQPRVSKRLPK